MQYRINYVKSLPKKRMASGVLIFNKKNELLILKTSYKDYWGIPGGVIDFDESPFNALIRELKEEIGITIKIKNLIALEYKNEKNKKYIDESLQFIFSAEKLRSSDIKKIKVDGKEVIDYEFVPVNKALKLLSSRLSNRIKKLNNNYNQFIYLENGKKIF